MNNMLKKKPAKSGISTAINESHNREGGRTVGSGRVASIIK